MRQSAADRANYGPAPHGAGGLKSRDNYFDCPYALSRPARGGRIEITSDDNGVFGYQVPPRTGRAD